MRQIVTVIVVVLLILAAQVVWAKTGTIWTCNAEGIPQTVFASPRDVHVSGTGFSRGVQVYQITDSRGSKAKNLSGFKIRVRQVWPDEDGNLKPFSIWPFKPSAHGSFIFWLMPGEKYTGPDAYQNDPFPIASSLTLKFRVTGEFPHLPIVMVRAWDDHNYDHYLNEGEGGELPIPISVVDPLGGKQLYTTQAEIPITMKGWWDFEIAYSESFRLWVAMSRWVDGWEWYSYPGWGRNLNDGESHLLWFGMYLPAPVTVYVFNDKNGNGRWGSDELPIPGMWIYCDRNGTPFIAGASPSRGVMDFPPLWADNYTFYPLDIGSWIPTRPTTVPLCVVEGGNYQVYFGFKRP